MRKQRKQPAEELIRIRTDQKARLTALGKKNQSYADVIDELLGGGQ